MNKPGEFISRRDPLPLDFNSLTVRVPGSSANLGPGFDTLALACKIYCTLQICLLEKNDARIPLITLKGQSLAELPADRSNLIYTVLAGLWQNNLDLLQRVRITIDSEIPVGKGLGSSAAAITGALWAGCALRQQIPESQSILAKAAEIEGHADNASASLLGGLVVSAFSRGSHLPVTQKLPWPDEWATIISVPTCALSTKKSRSVLPDYYSRADAVHNLQKTAFLLSAVQNRDEEALSEALDDRMHEPYRIALVPQLAEIRKVVSDLPVIGCVLSGAGSSVLTIVHQKHRQQLLECLRAWSCKNSQQSEILDLTVDQEGLKVSYE
jgi:homoserine kinase